MNASGTDPVVLHGARRALERHGWQHATLERIAAEADLSRMTLHRRGVSREGLLAALAAELETEHRDASYEHLIADGTGRERLEAVLATHCRLAERNLALLAALSQAERDLVHHEPGDGATREVTTRPAYTAAVRRLLLDGAADGSLRTTDADETATVLVNLVGQTYRHLREGHGWSPRRARTAVLEIALNGLAA